MDLLYPAKKDFFLAYSKIAPVSLFLIRAKECELFASYVYERPILDIGCGEGIFAQQLFSEQIDMGYDLSLCNVQSAKTSRAYKNVCCGKAEALPFTSCFFRTVISNCVLEHVEDVDMVLSEIYRVLAPGGRAYLSVTTPFYSEAHSLSDLVYDKTGVRMAFGPKIIDRLFSHTFNLDSFQWKEKITKTGLTIKEMYPYLSPQVLHIMGIFLVFSISPFICKMTINRWRIFPQLNRPKVLMNFIRKCYDEKSKEGGCLFFVVSKDSDRVA